MAYAQWATFKILPHGCDVKVEDVSLSWGKLHKNGDKDHEIHVNDINGTIVKNKQDFTISTCGRSDAASGTEGNFSLYYNNSKLCTIFWDCPWGSKKNTCSLRKEDGFSNFVIELDGANMDSGALGNIRITLVLLPS